MHFHVFTRLTLAWVFALSLGFTTLALGQQPNTSRVQQVLAKYQAERAEALKLYQASDIQLADEQAEKAQQYLKNGNEDKAERLLTDARWLLPVTTKVVHPNVKRVFGASRLRHANQVNSLVYVPGDASLLVSGAKDGTVRVWDYGNGRENLVYRGHEELPVIENPTKEEINTANTRRVAAVAVSHDGKLVASCGGKEIHVWELATGKLTAKLKGHEADVFCLAFHPSQPDVLLSGGADALFKVWSISKLEATHTSDPLNEAVNTVAFSPNGQWVGAADEAGFAVIFRMDNWERPAYGAQTSESKELLAMTFLPDNARVLFGGGDSVVHLVSGPGGPEDQLGVKIRKYESGGGINSVAATQDGSRILGLNESERAVLIWDTESGKQLRAIKGDVTLKNATSMALRSDGKQVAVGYETGVIKLYNLSDFDDNVAFNQATDNLWSAVYSPDGSLFAVAGADRVIRVYDTATEALKQELKGHQLSVTALAFTTNNRLLSCGGDRVVKSWDLNTSTATDYSGHTQAILALTVDRQGTFAISGGADKTIRCWNLADGKELWSNNLNSAVCSVAISNNGRKVAVATANGKLTLFNKDDNGVSLISDVSAHTGGVACVVFNESGDRVATGGGDGLARVWNVTEIGSSTPTIFNPPYTPVKGTPPLPITSVAFSPDGRQLAGAGAEGVVRIWDVLNAGEIRPLRAHTGWVTSIAYAPDGKSLLSCSVDRSARIFELPSLDTGPTTHTDVVQCIAVSRNGKLFASGSRDNLVKVWSVETGLEVATFVCELKENGLISFGVTAVAFLGDDLVMGVGSDKRIHTWKISIGKLVNTKAMTDQGISFAVAPNETDFAMGYIGDNGDRRNGGFVFMQETGEPITVLEKAEKDKEDSVNCLALTRDASFGAIGIRDGSVRLWDVKRKEKLGGDWPLFKEAVYDLALTDDNATLLAVSDTNMVKIGDVKTREIRKTLEDVDCDGGIILAPTNDRFIALGKAGKVNLYSLDGELLNSMQLPRTPSSAKFSPDGNRIFTGNGDGSISEVVFEVKK